MKGSITKWLSKVHSKLIGIAAYSKKMLISPSVEQMLVIMHSQLCRSFFDEREDVIIDSELCKKGFMSCMDPDFSNPLCFCLFLSTNLIFFLPWHHLFFTPFIFIYPSMNFLFCIPRQHRFVCFIFQITFLPGHVLNFQAST